MKKRKSAENIRYSNSILLLDILFFYKILIAHELTKWSHLAYLLYARYRFAAHILYTFSCNIQVEHSIQKG